MFQRASRLFTRMVLIAQLGVAGFAATSCASAGQFVWYHDLPQSDWGTDAGEYVLGVGDAVNIRVYGQEPLTVTTKIRRDGRISLQLTGEVVAAGKHPSALAREIEGKLKQFIVSPQVTVSVETSQPITVSALGEISHVGTLTLEPPARLIDALALAGGPNDYANKSRIFVLRQFPQFQRIRFDYDALLRNEGNSAYFPLRTGDSIVIE